MKRMLAVLLALFAVAAPVAQASEIDLLKTLYQERGQTVVSPVSLNLALVMAAEGAKGETRAELLAAAGLSEETMAQYVEHAMALVDDGVSVANAVFIQEGFGVLRDYDDVVNGRYHAERFVIGNTDMQDKVNAWVKEKTQGLIEELLHETPDPKLKMMLVNALALKAGWAYPFMTEQTGKQAFHATDGDVEVDFMHRREELPYAKLDGMQAVRLPYIGSALGLTVILPDGDIASALDALSRAPVDWDAAFGNREVVLALPKLSTEDSLSLVDALKAFGVQAAFDEQADFSGIDGKTDLWIGSVLQKTRLDMDEAGTTAATAISLGAAAGVPMDPPVEFTVDRPYILLLTDGDTGLTLFAAAIDKP